VNFNQKKIERYLVNIEERTREYRAELAKNNLKDNSITISTIVEKIERLKKNKLRYEVLVEKLKGSGQRKISTTDQDARALLVQKGSRWISYTIQGVGDNKPNLVSATHTTNPSNLNALRAIALEVK
jgi:hypothetical protein